MMAAEAGVTPAPRPGGERRGLLALLALAAVLRVAWWMSYVDIIENEGVEYTRLAWNWFHGQGYVSVFGGTHTLFPPLYPFLIGLLAPLAGSEESAARLVSLLAGLGLVAAAQGTARDMFGRRVALLAGVLAAAHPALVALSVTTFSEGLYLGLAAGATRCTVACLRRPSWRAAAGAGGFAGLAYLTRPEGILLAIGLGGLLLLAGRSRLRSWPAGLRHAALAWGTAALLAAPYAAHLSRIAGSFRWEGKSAVNNLITLRQRLGLSYSEAGRGLGPGGEPEGPFLQRDQHRLLSRGDGGGGLLRALTEVPPWRIRAVAEKVAGAGFLGAQLAVLLALAGLAFTAWWRTRLPEGMALLVLPATVGLALLTLQFTMDRYLLALLPTGLIWGAAGADAVGEAAGRLAGRFHAGRGTTRAARLAVSGVLALGVPAIAGASVARMPEFAETRAGGVRNAGLWLQRDHAGARGGGRRPLIAGLGLAVAHYAGGEMTYLPYADEARALRYLQQRDPDYVALRFAELYRLPYAPDWLRRGPSGSCTTPVEGLPAAAGAELRLWRWTCDPATSP